MSVYQFCHFNHQNLPNTSPCLLWSWYGEVRPCVSRFADQWWMSCRQSMPATITRQFLWFHLPAAGPAPGHQQDYWLVTMTMAAGLHTKPAWDALRVMSAICGVNGGWYWHGWRIQNVHLETGMSLCIVTSMAHMTSSTCTDGWDMEGSQPAMGEWLGNSWSKASCRAGKEGCTIHTPGLTATPVGVAIKPGVCMALLMTHIE